MENNNAESKLNVDNIVDKTINEVEQSLVKTSQNVSVNKLNLDNGLTNEQLEFISLMIPMQFNVSNICDKLGISRRTFYHWMELNPNFKETYEETRGWLIDKAEQVLIKALENADVKTAQFILTKLDKRYKDKIDITSNGNTLGTIINIIAPNQDAQGD